MWVKHGAVKIVATSVIVCLVAVMTVVFIYQSTVNRKVDLSAMEITALDTEHSAVLTSSSFLIKSGRDYSENEIIQFLSMAPFQDFGVTREKPGQYVLTTQQPLKEDTLYNIRMTYQEETKSWAFQTKKEFAINATLPATGATYVPVNTGIEFVLSHQGVSLEQFKSCFSIEPMVEGTFEQHGYTIVFVPNEPLRLDTLYKVTIKKELSNTNAETLKEDQVIRFRTDPDNNSKLGDIRQERFSETFLTSDLPVIEYNNSEVPRANNPVQVSVYPLKDQEEYLKILSLKNKFVLEELQSSEFYQYDTTGLNASMKFDAVIQKAKEWGSAYIVFPERLKAGCYLVNVAFDGSLQGRQVQKLVQVNDTSVYLQAYDEKTLFWVNDTTTGKPVANATVQVFQDGLSSQPVTAVTGEDGVAMVQTKVGNNYYYNDEPGRDDHVYFKVVNNGKVVNADEFYPSPSIEHPATEDYFAYLYTDRPIYKPTDTIQFWGIIRKRTDAAQIPEKLNASLSVWGEPLETVPITIAADGSFFGEISFEKITSGYFDLRLDLPDGRVLLTQYTQIADYEKPVYRVKTTPTKDIYGPEEQPQVDVNISFFDGTPAAGVAFEYYLEGSSAGTTPPQQLKTDAQGNAKVLMDASLLSFSDTSAPQQIWYKLVTNDGIHNGGVFYYCPRSVVIWSDQDRVIDHNNKITLHTNKLDLSKTTRENYAEQSPQNYIGETLDTAVQLKVFEEYYVKVKTGQFYDFINKKTVETYEYRRQVNEVTSTQLKTVGGTLEFDASSYIKRDDAYYYVEASVRDSLGGQVLHRVSLVDNVFYYNYITNDFHFAAYADSSYYESRLSTNFDLKENENISLKLVKNMRDVIEGGNILYTANAGKILGYKTQPTGEFNVNYGDYMPNTRVSLYGAYFDGKHVYEVSQTVLNLDASDKTLDIQVQSDQENYLPGEQVTLEVTVKDQQGNPVQANVCTSVVDEAIFALSEDYNNDPLDVLYQNNWYNQPSVYVSYVEHRVDLSEGGGMGGGGGNGGVYVRDDFRDTAVFLNGRTDAQGKTTLKFKMPDNLTSWRATSIAISDDMRASNAQEQIIVTQPFFLQPKLPDRYLVGDAISFSAGVYGTGLKSGAEIHYTVRLQSGDMDQTKDEVTTDQLKTFSFGDLPAGEYKVTFVASSEGYDDSVIGNFTVVESAIELPQTRVIDLGQPLDIAPTRYPVVLGVYDKQYETFAAALNRLYAETGGRTDQLIAKEIALQKILTYCDESEKSQLQTSKQISRATQSEKGGIQLYGYGDPSAKTSAEFAVAAQNYVNPQDLSSYLFSVINSAGSNDEDIAAAFMGLAALKKSVLLDIRLMLDNATALGSYEKICLTAALAYAGDTDAAKAAYEQYVKPMLKQEGRYLFVSDSGNFDTDYKLTATALLCAATVQYEDADGLARFLLEHSSKEYIANMELAAYVQNYQPKYTENASFSYLKNGKNQTVSLKKSGLQYLVMGQDQLKTANFKVIRGDVGANVRFIGSNDIPEESMTEGITITKTIQDYTENYAMQGSKLVILDIAIDQNMPNGAYEITDYLPTGMRYMQIDRELIDTQGLDGWKNGNGSVYVYDQEKQLVKMMLYKPEYVSDASGLVPSNFSDGKFHYQIAYRAIDAIPGNYVLESAYITHRQSGMTAKTERGSYTIARSTDGQTTVESAQ